MDEVVQEPIETVAETAETVIEQSTPLGPYRSPNGTFIPYVRPIETMTPLTLDEIKLLISRRLRSQRPSKGFYDLMKMYLTLIAPEIKDLPAPKKRGRPVGSRTRSKAEKLDANVNALVKKLEEGK